MPIYEFACEGCGHGFEELTRPGETPPCPACGAAEVRRVYTPVNVPRVTALGLRGAKARDSNARRAEREAAKRERFSEQRKKKKSNGR